MPQAGTSLQLALMAAGPHQAALTAWAQWWHEVSAIPYSVSDPSVADRKLVWWGQAVKEAFESTPQHPLLQAMVGPGHTLAQPPLPLWLEQIDGLRALTQQTRWLDDATLARHAWATTGAACEGAAILMGAQYADTRALARQLGVGLRRAHILARLGQDARQGWLHIPIDVLQAHGVRAHELLRPNSDTPSQEIRQLLGAWHDLSSQALSDALCKVRSLPSAERRALKPLVVLAHLQLTLLNDLKASGYKVLTQRILLGPWRKRWTAWRARWR